MYVEFLITFIFYTFRPEYVGVNVEYNSSLQQMMPNKLSQLFEFHNIVICSMVATTEGTHETFSLTIGTINILEQNSTTYNNSKGYLGAGFSAKK